MEPYRFTSVTSGRRSFISFTRAAVHSSPLTNTILRAGQISARLGCSISACCSWLGRRVSRLTPDSFACAATPPIPSANIRSLGGHHRSTIPTNALKISAMASTNTRGVRRHTTSPSWKGNVFNCQAMRFNNPVWVPRTPFGRPVEPDVYSIYNGISLGAAGSKASSVATSSPLS